MRSTGNPWLKYLLAVTSLVLILPATAADVFRWTDESGHVHYGQRPPGDGGQRIELPQAGSSQPQTDAETAQRRDRQQRLLEAYEYERAQKKTKETRAVDERRQTAARCQELQRHWRRLSFPGPVYVARADGQREYLSDEQRASQKAAVRPEYVKACGQEP